MITAHNITDDKVKRLLHQKQQYDAYQRALFVMRTAREDLQKIYKTLDVGTTGKNWVGVVIKDIDHASRWVRRERGNRGRAIANIARGR